jgi:hypothetical protein
MNLIDKCYDSLNRGSDQRKASTYTQQHNTKRQTNIHTLNGIRTHDLSDQTIEAFTSDLAASGTGRNLTLHRKYKL